ncbi:hypothetical protein QIS74_05362 [Colletotrichum tabaci]|uniref:Uncharacterized protein n=1 Tax=Colletotrichum tabaci TaxID=1209068 RepID=A0AAV9TEU8_9PEZI
MRPRNPPTLQVQLANPQPAVQQQVRQMRATPPLSSPLAASPVPPSSRSGEAL